MADNRAETQSSNKFSSGLKRKAENSEDQASFIEPEHKRRKLIDANEVKSVEILPSNASNTDQSVDLVFKNLPREIIEYYIIVLIPIDWLRVSKYYQEVAMKNIDRDPRIMWDSDSFKRAIVVDNVPIVIKHLEISKFQGHFVQEQFKYAASNGCAKVVQFFLDNDHWLVTLDRKMLFTLFLKATEKAIYSGHKEIVVLVMNKFKIDFKYRAPENILIYAALNKKRKDILEILIEYGFYKEENMFVAIMSNIHHNDPDLLHLVCQIANLTEPEYNVLFTSAVSQSANQIVEYFLNGPLAQRKTLDEKVIHLAIVKRNVPLMQRLLSDERFSLSPHTVDRAIKTNDPVVLLSILSHPRIQNLVDQRYIIRTAITSGAITLVQLFTHNTAIDFNSVIDDQLLDLAMANGGASATAALMVLNHPKLNFNYYASFMLCKALQYNHMEIAEAIIQDKRFIVIDDRHLKTAIDSATKNSKMNVVNKLQSIKYVARLSPTEIWTPNE